MKMAFLLGATAIIASLATTSANAALVNISGAGLFNKGTPTTAESKANTTFAFSFATNNPTSSNPDMDIFNPTYTLGAKSISATITSVTFYNTASYGLFDLNFSDGGVISLYGADVGSSGYIMSGTYTANVGYNDAAPPSGTGNGFVAISAVSAVPLPASAPMFGAALLGLAGLGYTAKRKKAAAAA